VIYVPLSKELSREFTVHVRAAEPEALRADLLTLVNRIDPRITWTSIRRGDMRFQDEAREMAGALYVIGAAGTVALVLSATGLYAVLSYIVALRRREIGVRLAIGAPPSRIVTLVIRQALTLVLAGMRAGWPWPCRWRSPCARPSSPKSPPPIRWSSCRRSRCCSSSASSRPPSPPFVHLESIRSLHCGRNRDRIRVTPARQRRV
jgi:hypothetical protein